RAVDLDDAAARQAADAERDVEAERAGRDDVDLAIERILAEAHDRALAELLLDRSQREIDRLVALLLRGAGLGCGRGLFRGHLILLGVSARPPIIGVVGCAQVYRLRLTFFGLRSRFEADSQNFRVHGTTRFHYAFIEGNPLDTRCTEHLFRHRENHAADRL